jgi:hypothetical protein
MNRLRGLISAPAFLQADRPEKHRDYPELSHRMGFPKSSPGHDGRIIFTGNTRNCIFAIQQHAD